MDLRYLCVSRDSSEGQAGCLSLQLTRRYCGAGFQPSHEAIVERSLRRIGAVEADKDGLGSEINTEVGSHASADLPREIDQLGAGSLPPVNEGEGVVGG